MDLGFLGRKKKPLSFEALAMQAERQVYKTCFHMMGNAQDAADCAQETMLRAYRAFSSFRQDAQFSTWITRIALNVCTDELRRRRPVVSLEEMREETGFDPPSGQKSVYAQLEDRERMRLLRKALSELPEDARRLIVMRDLRNMSYEEIASVLDLPLGTVKSRISRARNKLAELLKVSAELFSSASV